MEKNTNDTVGFFVTYNPETKKFDMNLKLNNCSFGELSILLCCLELIKTDLLKRAQSYDLEYEAVHYIDEEYIDDVDMDYLDEKFK